MPGRPRRITARCSASVTWRLSQMKRRRSRAWRAGSASSTPCRTRASWRADAAGSMTSRRVGEDRGLGVVGRQQDAVAIDDVGAAGTRGRRRRAPPATASPAAGKARSTRRAPSPTSASGEHRRHDAQACACQANVRVDLRAHRALARPGAGRALSPGWFRRRARGLRRSEVASPDGRTTCSERLPSSSSLRSGMSSICTI